MLELQVPGFKDLCLKHLVLDYNGTLACDGRPLKGNSMYFFISQFILYLLQSLKVYKIPRGNTLIYLLET